MRKILVPLAFSVMVIANLSLLIFVSSCDTSNSSFIAGEKMMAVRRIFPSAIDISETSFVTSQGTRISGRLDDTKISEIKGDSGILGYCVESKVVSRSGPFRIRVLLDKRFYVKQVTVISYPWDRGRDVCKRGFTDQFKGKGPEDAIRLGKDIDAMTGATISSRAVTEGVRDAVELVKLVKENRTEKQTGKSISTNQQQQHTEK